MLLSMMCCVVVEVPAYQTGGGRLDSSARLFITDVPAEVRTPQIAKVLRQAGRDPTLDRAVQSFRVVEEQNWTTWIRELAHGNQIEHVDWRELNEEAAGWRRITLRVRPEIYVMAQAESQRRAQSLTQFCVDAIAAQVQTRARRVEYEVFRFIRSGGFSERKRSVFLPYLQQYIEKNVRGCENAEVIDALQRLHPRFIKLDKWEDDPLVGFRSYDAYQGDVGLFFYRGDIRLEITADGQPYFEALANQFELPGPPGEASGVSDV